MSFTNAENIELVSELEAHEEEALRKAHDELASTSWLSAFFNPFGAIPRVVFTRGQLILWLVRLLTIVPAFIIGIAGMREAAGVLILIGVVGTGIVSLIMHIQRLEHAGRATWLAGIVALPILIAASFSFMRLMAIQAKIDAAKAAAIAAMQARQAAAEAPAAEMPPVAEPEEAAPAEAGEGASAEGAEGQSTAEGATEGASDAKKAPRRAPPQPQGPPPLPIWAIFLMMAWVPLSALASIFTWAYAARVERRPDTFSGY